MRSFYYRRRSKYRPSSGKKTTEPGYRYAKEREAYMNLTPEQRQKAKAKMEAYWSDEGCHNPVHKNRVACPTLFD